MISREWNSIPYSPWKVRTGLCIGREFLQRWDFTASDGSPTFISIHLVYLPFQSCFCHKPSWVLQLTMAPPLWHSYDIYHSAGIPPLNLHCPGIPYCPGSPTLLPLRFLASFAGVTSLRAGPWPSALLSQFLPPLWCLTQSHSFSYFLPTDDSQIETSKILYSLPSC